MKSLKKALAPLISKFINLTDTPNDLSGLAGKLLKINSSEDGIDTVDQPAAGSDESVKVDATDTTSEYLEDKLQSDNDLSIVEVDKGGGNKALEIRSIRVPQWDSGYTYAQHDTISYLGKMYRSLQASNTNQNPLTETAYWADVDTDTTVDDVPDWDSGHTYSQNDVIAYLGELYKSLQNSNTNQNPVTETAYWEQITSVGGGGGGGAVGADGTVLAGDTETTITFAGEAGNYNRATVSTNGNNGGQRAAYVKNGPYDDGADLSVDIAIDTSYSEDIDVHVVLAAE